MGDIKPLAEPVGNEPNFKVPGAPGAVVVAEDPAAPSPEVSSKKQRLSDLFTIFCSGFALISDGYQNNLMTMTNVLLKKEYKKEYTSAVSTRVSNALLVGEILGQIAIGLTCDYLGRKVAIVTTTALIVIGGILATASHGKTIDGMFWMMTISRGIVGFGTGGEYPASSTSASEAANEHTLKRRGPIFILVTNLPLSFGNPLAAIVFLIVLSAVTTKHLSTVWRVTFAFGCLLPLTVFYFRVKMLNSKLYRRGAIKRRVPYLIIPLFVIFYGLMQSSGNLGPGDMLGLLSSESYATAVRGVVGVLITWIFVKDVRGDDLANEDEQFRAFLVSRGWNGEMGEDDLQAIADKGIPPSVVEEVRDESR
ncbi:MAG: hypothetical protein Q9191_002597 [Dirinaria sp. TL-2023a]